MRDLDAIFARYCSRTRGDSKFIEYLQTTESMGLSVSRWQSLYNIFESEAKDNLNFYLWLKLEDR